MVLLTVHRVERICLLDVIRNGDLVSFFFFLYSLLIFVPASALPLSPLFFQEWYRCCALRAWEEGKIYIYNLRMERKEEEAGAAGEGVAGDCDSDSDSDSYRGRGRGRAGEERENREVEVESKSESGEGEGEREKEREEEEEFDREQQRVYDRWVLEREEEEEEVEGGDAKGVMTWFPDLYDGVPFRGFREVEVEGKGKGEMRLTTTVVNTPSPPPPAAAAVAAAAAAAASSERDQTNQNPPPVTGASSTSKPSPHSDLISALTLENSSLHLAASVLHDHYSALLLRLSSYAASRLGSRSSLLDLLAGEAGSVAPGIRERFPDEFDGGEPRGGGPGKRGRNKLAAGEVVYVDGDDMLGNFGRDEWVGRGLGGGKKRRRQR